MRKRIEALVKPELLVWARESAGFAISEVAKKTQVSYDRIKHWEKGELKPTVNQLRKLAQIYKRPLSAFYLSEIPETPPPLRDFRRLPDTVSSNPSPQLRLEIRKAYYRRQVALDLYNMIGETLPDFNYYTNLSEEPESLGVLIRKLIGIEFNEQIKWRSGYEALNHWRSALENIGVLIFQASKISLTEMRGFSLLETPLPTIVLNIKDSPKGRIFTMLHEFVHIMLKDGGLCNLEEKYQSYEGKVEVFCNWVAGAVLVPLEQLLSEEIIKAKKANREWEDEEINQLAQRYSVSREVVLRRLLIADLITTSFYQEKREAFLKEYEKISKQEGYVPKHLMVISSSGSKFVRLVLNSFYQEMITISDLSDYLDVRIKHIPKIEKEVFIAGVRK